MTQKKTKTPSDFYFWLGADGELKPTTKTEFNQLQKEWDGVRPQDLDNI